MSSYPSVNSAIAKVLLETKLKVIDDLIVFMDSKIEIDDDMKEMFDEFKISIQESDTKTIKAVAKGNTTNVKEKKKRSPSVFNLFVKNKQAELKTQHPEESGKNIIGMASKAWKTDPFAIFAKKYEKQVKKDHQITDNLTLYNKLKELYDKHGDNIPTDEEEPPPPPPKIGKGKKAAKKIESTDEDSD